MTSPTARPRANRLQDHLLWLFGRPAEERAPLISSMLRRDAVEATAYWLQLVVSIGIATLGLVVGSTAVVIGAMLVAPLMGPIVHLAMGLACGSPFLVLRSAARIGLSVLTAVGGAALITVLLPFHALNAEIAARTSPTVLDLLTACFCALAGVYATLRASSDSTSAAAGTAISISLVPPLCASGYGLGTELWPVAGGAALLFLTNLVAIVVVGTVSFVAAGFNRVDVAALEREELQTAGGDAAVSRGIARALSGLFANRWGPALRFLMPLALLAAVYVPLRSALDQVAWQVRVRAAVEASIERVPHRIIENRVRVERGEVEIVLVLLGSTSDAEQARAQLDGEIRQVSGVTPRIEVMAIPDATAFAGLQSTMLKPERVEALPAVRIPTENEQLAAVEQRVARVLADVWPEATAGKPLSIELGGEGDGALRLRVTHLGPALLAQGEEVVERALGQVFERKVQLVDVALPAEAIDRSEGDIAFAARLAFAARTSATVPGVTLCLTRPAPPAEDAKPSAGDAELGAVIAELLDGHPRVQTVEVGDTFRARLSLGPCEPAAAPAPAPAPEAPN